MLNKGKSGDMMSAKQKAIEELQSYLDGKDDDDFKSAIKPKGAEVSAIEIGGDDQKPEDDASKAPGADGMDADEMSEGGESDSPKMSDEEVQELIEALQSKLGA